MLEKHPLELSARLCSAQVKPGLGAYIPNPIHIPVLQETRCGFPQIRGFIQLAVCFCRTSACEWACSFHGLFLPQQAERQHLLQGGLPGDCRSRLSPHRCGDTRRLCWWQSQSSFRGMLVFKKKALSHVHSHSQSRCMKWLLLPSHCFPFPYHIQANVLPQSGIAQWLHFTLQGPPSCLHLEGSFSLP